MRLSTLVEASQRVAATRSRLEKRAALAEALALAPPDEIALVVTYLSGTLPQRRTGIGWATLGSVDAVAAEPTLEVAEVDTAFSQAEALAGSGSQSARRDVVLGLWGRATAEEQEFLRGLVFDDLRQGALDGVMLDAVAAAYDVPVASVRRAAMLLGSTARAAETARTHGTAGLDAVRLEVGTPVRPMLAASAPDVPSAFEKAGGGDVVVDTKLDGIRIQVHRAGEEIRVFTRSLDDITARVPEVVAAASQLATNDAVLDGEAIVLRNTGRPAPFQVTGSRTASSADLETLQQSAPLSTYFFDALRVDGRDLLDEPLSTRLAVLDALVPLEHRTRTLVAPTPDEAQAHFDQVVADGQEGVVVKAADAPYAAGRRGSGWVKVKPRHTLDLVVLAAEWGHGRRSGWLSNLHLGARDGDEFCMLGKTFKGLTDELLTWQTARFLELETSRTKSTVYVRPELVVEIAFDGVQTSPRYPGGVALRFARVLRYRDDKTAAEADTLSAVQALQT